MMKAYNEYKTSKFKWVDEIPSHWKEGKISYLFEIGRGRVISMLDINPEGKYPVYSSQTKDDGCMGFLDTYDFDDNFLTWTTDGANAGTVFIRSGKFNCTNVCGTLKPKKSLDLKYFLYYLQHVTQFYKRPDTNGAKIMNNEMAAVYSLFPTINEQIRISRFLDYQTAIIDEIIQRKEKQIELLKEKRQSIINEVVTKGLNSSAKMKESGIDWLGEIPEECEIKKMKYTLEKIMGGGTPTTANNAFWIGTIPWVSSKDMKSDTIYDSIDKISESAIDNSSTSLIGKNNVLVVVRSGILRHSFPVCINAIPVAINQDIKALFVEDKLLYPKYMFWYLKGVENEILSFCMKTGATVESIDMEILKSFPIVLHPLDKQEEIIAYIEKKNELIKKIVIDNNFQIEKLKEYRQSLISEAVTGKIDLRYWEPLNKTA